MPAVQIFWNTVGRGEIVSQQALFSFSYSVFYPSVEFSAIFIKPKLVVCKLFNFFSNKPWVYVSAVQVFENTVRKKKLLILNNVSFSYIVFYPSIELSAIFIKSKIVVCKLFNSFPNKPLFLHACNADFLKTFWEKEKSLGKWKSLGKGRKHYQHFFPFPMFSKGYSFRVVKSRDCEVKR